MPLERSAPNLEHVRYDFPDYPIYIRYGLLSSYPDFSAASHWHDDIELIAVLEGEMQYNVNGILTTLKSGEGIFVNSGQLHFGFSEQRSECRFFCVLLHPSLLGASHAFEQDYILPLTRSGTAFVHLSPDTPWQKEIYGCICSFYEGRNEKTAPLRILSGFARIWTLLLENLPAHGQPDTPESPDLAIIKRMADFVQKHYAEKLTLADIAAAGAVGQSKCCRLFARYFSLSPILYLNRYRLSKSVELLKSTELTVTEIAFSVGFHSASYYAEAFRGWSGKSPTEFKKEAGDSAQPPAKPIPDP